MTTRRNFFDRASRAIAGLFGLTLIERGAKASPSLFRNGAASGATWNRPGTKYTIINGGMGYSTSPIIYIAPTK